MSITKFNLNTELLQIPQLAPRVDLEAASRLPMVYMYQPGSKLQVLYALPQARMGWGCEKGFEGTEAVERERRRGEPSGGGFVIELLGDRRDSFDGIAVGETVLHQIASRS
jgi:hypothetical protein